MKLSYSDCKNLFEYEPETGLLFWKNLPPKHPKRQATVCMPSQNYSRVVIKGKAINAASVVWTWNKGHWPEGRLRRKDKDRYNDRIENLMDMVPKPDLSFDPRYDTRMHTAQVDVRYPGDENAKMKFLGMFATREEADAAEAVYLAGEDLV